MAGYADLFKPSYTPAFVKNPALSSAVAPRTRTQKVGDFIDSPTGKLLASGVGTFLDARDNKATRDAELASDALDRASRERIATQGQLGDLTQAEMADSRARAAGVLDANPLGAEHNFAAKEAFLRNAAGLFGNTAITPSDPAVAGAMGKVSGGFQITPDFIRALQEAHSQNGVNGAIAQRRMDTARLDPGRGLATPIGDAGLDSRVSDYAAQQHSQMDLQAQMRREAIQRALDNNPTGAPMSPEEEFNKNFDAIAAAKQQTGDWEKAYQMVTGKPWPKGQGIKINPDGTSGMMHKDSSKWKMMGKIASIAAPIAATVFTGGAASPWLASSIGAASGAANGALSGGGVKGALLGAGIGALSSGIPTGGAKVPMSAALKQAVLNPRAATGIAGQVLPGRAGTAAQLANMALNFRR